MHPTDLSLKITRDQMDEVERLETPPGIDRVQDRVKRGRLSRHLGLSIRAPVFLGAAAVTLVFVVVSLLNLELMRRTVDGVQEAIATRAGWFYVLVVNLFLGFAVYLMCSRYGSLRLGQSDAKPDFSYWEWFAMLFSAGMGIGLLFWSVAEPVSHYAAPPTGVPRSAEAAQQAMSLTFLHWGLHCWAIYAVVGLALAYFGFGRGLPFSIRSGFYPLIGDRIYGPLGDLVDLVAAVATVFGLATSLGLGVQQVNAGLAHLFGLSDSIHTQIVLIAVITAGATTSVVLGLDRGLKRISLLNMGLAALLLLLVLAMGPTTVLLEAFIQNVGQYVENLPELATWTEAYRQTTWQHDWTIFYWGWWIGWAPFVGMFIARISRGRTVREYLVGVIFVPTVITFLWLTVFGNTAMFAEQTGSAEVANAVEENVAVALFVMLEELPLAFYTSVLGILVVVIFFVSSSDSASLVVDIITAGGHTNPPRKQRVFWAVTEGAVAAVLLLGGGLEALRTASISTGLPFAIVLALLCVSVHRGLRADWLGQSTVK